MMTEKVHFENRQGHRLGGLIDWPADRHGGFHAIALFAHCFTCTKNLRAATNIARALNAEGIAVMRFDFTGLGDSEGDFSDTTFASNVDDLVDAANWLKAQFQAPSLLIGHSLGGTAVLQAAPQITEAVAVATIGSPSTPTHVAHLFKDASADIEANGQAEVLLAGRPFTIRKQFVDDLAAHPLAETVRGLRKALLIMHSPVDETVEISNASDLFATAMHPKSFVSLDKADHLLSNPADSLYAGGALAGWARRYLPRPDALGSVADGHTLAETRAGSFRTTIQSGQHALVADEPAAVGGANSGPTPHGLLAAALASCTTMTLQMYAKHKDLPLDTVRVDVTHEKQRSDAGSMDVFTRDIELVGELNQETRERMLEIADKCPVHRTLHGEVRVINNLIG
ncbi:MAG: bifunctional alpha/beta hydrolase/OsmC family protein [Pseudomonadota bacterium]